MRLYPYPPSLRPSTVPAGADSSLRDSAAPVAPRRPGDAKEADQQELVGAARNLSLQRQTTPAKTVTMAWELRSKQFTARHPAFADIPSVLPSEERARTSLSVEMQAAAKMFDAKHRKATRAAENMELALRMGTKNESSQLIERNFVRAVEEVRRGRFVTPSGLPARVYLQPRPKQVADKPAWQLETSIWAPRRKWAESKSFWDTPEALVKALAADWAMACRTGVLVMYIVAHHKFEDDLPPTNDVELDEDGLPIELTRAQAKAKARRDAARAAAAETAARERVIRGVLDVFEANAELFYSIYDWYAFTGSGEIWAIQLNAFSVMLADCNLIDPGSKYCSAAHFDGVFISVNADSDAAGGMEEKYNPKRGVNRQELMACFVRIAVMRHILMRTETSVHRALQLLFEELAAGVPPPAKQLSNEFRDRCCYREETDAVLRRHEEWLRRLFKIYAHGDGALFQTLNDTSLLGIDEWHQIVLDCNLIDTQFGLDDATGSFIWSRMRAIVESADASRAKIIQLSFEDFLEALVRVAAAKAMPTDSDLEEAGAADSGQYLLDLERDPGRREKFLVSRDVHWSLPPLQPHWRAVDHLLNYLARLFAFSDGTGKWKAPTSSNIEAYKNGARPTSLDERMARAEQRPTSSVKGRRRQRPASMPSSSEKSKRPPSSEKDKRPSSSENVRPTSDLPNPAIQLPAELIEKTLAAMAARPGTPPMQRSIHALPVGKRQGRRRSSI